MTLYLEIWSLYGIDLLHSDERPELRELAHEL